MPIPNVVFGDLSYSSALLVVSRKNFNLHYLKQTKRRACLLTGYFFINLFNFAVD